jgi:hypothetical protein
MDNEDHEERKESVESVVQTWEATVNEMKE